MSGLLTGTAHPEDVKYNDAVENTALLLDHLMYLDPRTVPAEELKPLDDAFDIVYGRGTYHVNETLKRYIQ